MEYIKMPLGNEQMNGYIVYDTKTKEGAIIDPGYDFGYIKNVISENNIIPKYILLTHSHGDHIGAIKELKQEYKDILLGINVEEIEMLYDPKLNLSGMLQPEEISLESDFTFIDGEVIKIGDDDILVLHTPGHSPGGSCFVADKNVFVGDTIFKMGIGRYDFYKGDLEILLNSIKTKLLTLDEDVVLHPGHGPETTVGFEIERNPYL